MISATAIHRLPVFKAGPVPSSIKRKQPTLAETFVLRPDLARTVFPSVKVPCSPKRQKRRRKAA